MEDTAVTGGGKRILLVEDNRVNADLVRQTFREFGSDMLLQVVGSIEKARKVVATAPPDVAVIDLIRPADGASIELLRDEGSEPRFPVVILTDRGDQRSAVEAIKAGALDYIVKSDVTLKALPQIVGRTLREWQQIQLTGETERALRESKTRYKHLYQQFQALLDGIPDVLVLLDPDLRIDWINRAGQERFQTPPPSHAGEPGYFCYEIFHDRRKPCDGCPVVTCFQSGVAEDNLIGGSDGTIWGVKAFPLKDAGEEVQNVIILASEVTEKIKTRSEALRASQLATLGELAAGVAHEINNPANGIINYGQLLFDQYPEGSREQEIAQEIIEEGSRIARTVKNLLSFAQVRGEEAHAVRVEDILDACLDLSYSQIKKEGIRLRMELPPDLPAVHVQNQPIQQVVLNLISNARYALNEKYPLKDPDKQLLIRGRLESDAGRDVVRLEFSDCGVGIPEKVLSRVMDPFFTTKPADRGTGLGLSMSREIIRKQGGRILITSIEGESTTVVIELPVAAKGKPV